MPTSSVFIILQIHYTCIQIDGVKYGSNIDLLLVTNQQYFYNQKES
jgi:hypothetical protein